ncbi:MAG: sulfite exporter TauE/SafE family protein [Promethearchaeota archaeon]
MLGVGGCFIMVPVQFYILLAQGYDTTMAILTAFGTNLMVVLPTSIMGSSRHHKKKAVYWKQALILGILGAFASYLGAMTALLIGGNILTQIFGYAILAGSIRMIFAKPMRTEGEISDKTWKYVVAGLTLGFITGLIGIGGGVLMVPVLVLLLNFQMREAVGTSTAMMIFTSMGGAISYMILGFATTGLPPYSVGYVNFLQWILLALTSVPGAAIGVNIAHKINQKALKWVFVIVMIYMGLKMVGLFKLLNLPI